MNKHARFPVCGCGCGRIVYSGEMCLPGHCIEDEEADEGLLCACGCGRVVSAGREFCPGHSPNPHKGYEMESDTSLAKKKIQRKKRQKEEMMKWN